MHDDHIDAVFLPQAIELAVQNAEAGELPFGAVVVRAGEVLATGVNRELGDHDPTAHAEVDAIRNACRDLRTLALPDAVLVSSCEPCVLCLAAAAVAGISRVVYAAPTDLAAAMLGGGDPARPLLADMQQALRALVPEQVTHVPTEGEGRPFERFTNRGSHP
jgi:tRNA(Arg) A34 adenosine deaminase TadA